METHPADGAINIDPLELQKEDVGIRIAFTEPIDTKRTKGIFLKYDDESLVWLTDWSEDKMTLTLKYQLGADIPYDTKITVVIERAADLAGNEMRLEFSFTTKAKE